MIGVWVSGFCTAGAFVNALEQRWAWVAVLGFFATMNFVTGRDSIRGGR
jgi:uncharacterized membrane protein YedE/YeeE